MKDSKKDFNNYIDEDLREYLDENDADLRSISIQAVAKDEDESFIYEEDLNYELNKEVGESDYEEDTEYIEDVNELEDIEYIEDIDGLSSLLEDTYSFSDNFEEAFPGLIRVKKKI
ncbi:hypothetical protein [Clostridium sp.]|uniref:hypothetical protein n=1 Tax=Clostridium sp. TaxID=1506 RepID=UPI003464C86C